MQYLSFRIKNFRGIRELALRLSTKVDSPIITLVGLNESGKTTILEALSFFYENATSSSDKEIQLISGVVDDIHSLIPKRQRDNFNDSIELAATLSLDKADILAVENACKEYDFVPVYIPETIPIQQVYKFSASKHEKISHFWNLGIRGKKKRAKKTTILSGNHPAWTNVVKALKKQIPPIIYYPNFLFEFPDKIYLTEGTNESREQVFYRRLIQDILDSLDNDLEIETHLVKRAVDNEPEDREALESVVNKMSSKVTSSIFNPEISIFQSISPHRLISVSRPQQEENGQFYTEFKLRDGEDSFFIRERSLGFRWFFTFTMFTQFRVKRIGPNIKPVFLFDEPASNLHQTAQQRLRKSLSELATSSGATIIYSTHSHHLIDPQWLETTFIVRNKALSYEDDTQFTTARTDIEAIRYREFVANHPNQRTYFQPILDVLEYKPSNLEALRDVLMVEGKTDFYVLEYITSIFRRKKRTYDLLPGSGSGSLDTAIQLYYAWGRNFFILLDADKEGIKQRQRYIDKFGLIVESRIILLNEILPSLEKGAIEKIFEPQDLLLVQNSIGNSSNRFNKKQFHTGIETALIQKKKFPFSQAAKNRFRKLAESLDDKFKVT